MQTRTLLLALFALAFAVPARAQISSPEFPRRLLYQYNQVPAGSEFAVGVEIAVQAPWHIYTNPPSNPARRATELELRVPKGFRLLKIEYPPGVLRTYADGEATSVYDGPVQIVARLAVDRSVPPGKVELPAALAYMACDDQGVCKLPSRFEFKIPVQVAAAGSPLAPTGWQPASATARNQKAPQNTPPSSPGNAGQVDIQQLLRERGLLLVLGMVFAAGLLINLTPCVFPLIPVTIGFFGMQASGDRRRTFLLACAYVLGMAAMYSSLGLIAALAGKTFGFATQSPWVNAAIGLIIAALALSMFGVYEIRPPALSAGKGPSRSGYLGALMMGLLVGVAAAPCSGPVVLGLMAFTSTTGSVGLGLALFLTLSLGLGLPFLILGMFTGLVNALPRSGAWMETTKRVFGVVMLFGALYMARTLFPKGVYEVLSGAYWVAAGMYLIFGDHELAAYTGVRRFKAALGLLAGAWGVYALTLTGLKMELHPTKWPPVTEVALAEARAAGRPIVLDFRTPNCAACDELEERTFSDPRVRERMQNYAHFQVEVTDKQDFAAQLAKAHGVQGFPNIVFLGPDGQEIPGLRLTQFESPDQFLRRLDSFQAQLPSSGAAGGAPGARRRLQVAALPARAKTSW